LKLLKDRLEEVTGLKFNSMLANMYRDGHDSVAWHADDETTLGEEPTIASISFGDTRNFEMRKKPPLVIYLVPPHPNGPLWSWSYGCWI
jgi:alpha-ketoglutarate-dependent dioxygenase alkB family protein 3